MDITKQHALFAYLTEEAGEDVTLESISAGYNDSDFDTPVGEYLVLTDEEAYEAVRDDIESLIDDIGIMGVWETRYMAV